MVKDKNLNTVSNLVQFNRYIINLTNEKASTHTYSLLKALQWPSNQSSLGPKIVSSSHRATYLILTNTEDDL